MIRDFDTTDREKLQDIIKNMDEGYEVNLLSDIEKYSSIFVVYEKDKIIKGFSYSFIETNELGEKEAQVFLYVEPNSRKQGFGTALYRELEKFLIKIEPNLLRTSFRADIGNSSTFCQNIGFHKWWGSTELINNNGRFSKTELDFTIFEDKYLKEFIKMHQECYYPIQVSNDIKPHIAPEEIIIKYKLKNKDKVFLALFKDEILASVTIGDGEIDNLLVSPKYQGKGYGKQALQFGMNKLFEQGYKEIRLCYMENNIVAKNLYYSFGFKPLQTTHVYRKLL